MFGSNVEPDLLTTTTIGQKSSRVFKRYPLVPKRAIPLLRLILWAVSFILVSSHFKNFLKIMMGKTLTVNTNTLDHKSALPLYQKAGFNIYKTENHKRSASSQLENKEYL